MQMTGFKPWMPRKGEQLSDVFLLLFNFAAGIPCRLMLIREFTMQQWSGCY